MLANAVGDLKAARMVNWILNLRDRVLERHTSPIAEIGKQPTYLDRVEIHAGEQFTISLAGQAIGAATIDELLPD